MEVAGTFEAFHVVILLSSHLTVQEVDDLNGPGIWHDPLMSSRKVDVKSQVTIRVRATRTLQQ